MPRAYFVAPRTGGASANTLVRARRSIREFKNELPNKLRDAAGAAQTASVVKLTAESAKFPRIQQQTMRSGRRSAPGGLVRNINWDSQGDGTVRLDVAKLNQRTATKKGKSYWLIQEIGTGNTARMHSVTRYGGVHTDTIEVKTQVNRPIDPVLQWHAGGGLYFPPLRGIRTHQLDVIRTDKTVDSEGNVTGLQGGPAMTPLRMYILRKRKKELEPMTIKKEIQHKGYIQHGARQGMKRLRDELEKEVQTKFRNRG